MRIDDSFLSKYQSAIQKITTETAPVRTQTTKKPEKSFETVLKEAERASGVTFSKHAMLRMSEREIELTSEEMQKLNSAVESADSKGIRDSLILMGGKAFIVNIPSNVVVTVLNSEDIEKQKVFTNVDGAVII
ncbi:MAG TPA: TIGR02530 family flagellar biosynthesis protein [Bacillota bacterium]|nr:TIGR02530 family flagellar biosynthesis protein [Bacillota bacterium]HOK68678.1 TIGR02530 family flagellar biosynthesis protein [Bacillota bacterium]HPP86182.1 TIGR02530 family flagellar biosynthesis protein [Bacillota bacterium]